MDKCWNGKGGTTTVIRNPNGSVSSQLLWNLGAILHVGHADCAKHKIWKVVQDLSLRLCARSELKKELELELEQLLLLLAAAGTDKTKLQQTHHYFHRVKQMSAEIAILGGAAYQLCTHHHHHHHLINVSVRIMIDCWDHKVVGAP